MREQHASPVSTYSHSPGQSSPAGASDVPYEQKPYSPFQPTATPNVVVGARRSTLDENGMGRPPLHTSAKFTSPTLESFPSPIPATQLSKAASENMAVARPTVTPPKMKYINTFQQQQRQETSKNTNISTRTARSPSPTPR